MSSSLVGKFGLSVALTTPFTSSGAIDMPKLVAHARWCLDNGCDGVTIAGTTGEGASLDANERGLVMAALAKAGIDIATRVTGGVAAASLPEAIAQARAFLDAGCRALLVAPPFYFKNVPEEGVFAWYAALFRQLVPSSLKIILYNIPSVTAVPLSPDLIGRLAEAFPEIVVGVKDSSSDWNNTSALLQRFARSMQILVGDERHLAAAIRDGASGSICGMANVIPARLARMVETGAPDEAVTTLVDTLVAFPVTPGVKALVAHRTGEDAWIRVRPPLPVAGADAQAVLGKALDRALFEAVA